MPATPRALLRPLLLATTLATQAAWAGGLAGDGPRRRIDQETFLVLWDHQSRTEHLLVAARASGLTTPGAHLLALPLDAMLDRPLDGISAAIDRLLPAAAPIPAQIGEAPALAPRPGGLPELCKTWKLTCRAELLGWAEERLPRGELALIPLATPPEGPATSAYAHFRFETPRPVIPFAEPAEDRSDPDPPPPGPDHPPRVQIFLELYNESPAGRWERQMDNAAEARRDDLVACYSKALEPRRKLAGSVHVQLRMGGDSVVSDEDERADSKPLEPVARCFAAALSKGAWPKNPFKKPIRFEAHATLRPPAATPRRTLVVVLSTQDAEPRLGDADEPRVVPELKAIASLEPEPEALRQAFPDETRKALGLDLSRRWRLIAFETGVDPHGPRDDIQLRPLTLPAPRPGAAPLPVVTRGDRPDRKPSLPAPRWWQRRGARRAALALATLLLLALVLQGELRKPREKKTSAT